MMKLTFKNVGQGDSIILEWSDKDGSSVGIIDCNMFHGQNPVLDYLRDNIVTNIKFLILSHPHSDHFSGYSQLLSYCVENKIQIGYFLHTCNNMPKFWKAAVDTMQSAQEIMKLFDSIRDVKNQTGMKNHQIQGEAIVDTIELSEDFSMQILNPTGVELDKYARKYIDGPIEEEIGNAPSANWLSTVLKIFNPNQNWFILLTSDAHKDVLFYNGVNNRKEYNGELVLAQFPHHGSKANFKKSFWSKINTTKRKIPLVISVGDNHYGHPSEEVITELTKLNYQIFQTDNGRSTKSSASVSALDFCSTLESGSIGVVSDLIFNITPNGVVSKTNR